MITVRASLALAALAACGGKGAPSAGTSPTPPTPPGDRAAADAPPPPSAPVPPLPGDGPRAFVADKSGLVEVAVPGGSQIVAPAATWCNVDARAKVVWFVGPDGLHAFDLTDRRTRTIIKGSLGELEVIVDWGDQRLGGESGLLFDVGAAIKLTGRPAIEVVMGCEGDLAFQCFGDDGEVPLEHVAEKQQLAGTLKLADPAYVAQLASRGRQGSLWTPPPVPPAPPKNKPAVDRKRCEEDPNTCGELTAIPGSPLWLVETANSRGDFYHQTRTLWDPATGEYVRRERGKLVRSKTPPPSTDGDTDHGGLRISATGVLSFRGAVFDAAKVHHEPQDGNDGPAVSCGWTDGGWRVSGPTDGSTGD